MRPGRCATSWQSPTSSSRSGRSSPTTRTILVSALADEDAQAAAQALGCTVTVVTSAEDYQQQIEAAYEGMDEDGGRANV